MNKRFQKFGVIVALFTTTMSAQAQVGTSISYQGLLKQNGTPLTGTCDLLMSLWNALSAGTQIGTTQTFLAQSVTAGQINVSPDFGTGAFDGNDRWIQIAVRAPAGGGTYTTLTPRQKLGAVPYALYSVGGNTGFTLPYTGSAAAVNLPAFQITNTANGGTGIMGRATAASTFGVAGQCDNSDCFAVYGINVPTGTSGRLGDTIAGVRGVAAVNNGSIGVHGSHSPSANYGQLGTANYGVYGLHNATQTDGRLGSAAAGVNGAATLNNGTVGVHGSHVSGHYGQLGTAIYGVLGDGTGGNGLNVGVFGRSDAIAYTPDGTDGAAVIGHHVLTGAIGRLGGSGGVAVHGIAGAANQYAGWFAGDVQIASGALDAYVNSRPVVILRRGVDDGVVVQIGGVITAIAGSISVSGQTVSYNAFTGSHFGWTNQPIERGILLSMTGINRSARDDADAEVIYGIAPSSAANDPRCMGAYLSLQEPNKPQSTDNPHLIMAVGNGDMWVAQSGTGDIQPGDYLISSDVPGCAMKDDPQRFPIGYIVARAGEAVDWSSIDSPTDGSAKRKKISVFFENFVRDSRGAQLATIVEQQNQRIESLEAQIRSLQLMAERLAALERFQDVRASVTAVSKSPSMAGGDR